MHSTRDPHSQCCSREWNPASPLLGVLLLPLVLALIAPVVFGWPQNDRKAGPKATEDAGSRLAAETGAPHARKGKKGFTVDSKWAEAPREAVVARRRVPSQTAVPAKKPPALRSSNVVASARPPERESAPTPLLASSDRIEVIEWEAKGASGPRSSTAGKAGERARRRTTVSTRRIEVEIDSVRVTQIQQALVARGLLTGEPSGIYDEATFEAMRQFQGAQKIDVTGYPTAHSLKRLGL